jgi:uncharacterized protein
MEPIPDFSNRRNFPGTHDNEFDIILRRVEDVEKIPSLLFAGILFLLALLATLGNWPWTVLLWLFFLGDWLLLALLPRFDALLWASQTPCPDFSNHARGVRAAGLSILSPASRAAGNRHADGDIRFLDRTSPYSNHLSELTSPKLRPGKPIRILHLGDLHVERITQRERQLNQIIAEQKPDLILFSGDILNLSYLHDPIAWQAAREVMGQWHAPGGVFVVTGSPAVDLEQVFPHLVEGLPLEWLQEDHATVTVNGQTIDIIGLTCTHKPFLDSPRLEALADRASGNFTILLYHTPDLAPNAANTGTIDLQLSGHTHGGQIRLPGYGAFFAGSLYGKRFEVGRSNVGSMTLYVSRGIGLEGKAAPRVRFFCPPEIIFWEIDGSEAGPGQG